MRIIGEKINGSISAVASAITNRNNNYIQRLAQDQAAAGAHFIDINAGTFHDQEPPLLAWLAANVQEATDLPLCIDSPNPTALAQALTVVSQKPIINSITLDSTRYNQVMPLIKCYQPSVIALCLDEKGIPPTANRRFEIACRIVDKLTTDGVDLDDIYLDVMVQPIGTDSTSGRMLLDTVRAVKTGIPDVHICCGLSNISFGLPRRCHLNQSFAVMLIACGIDTLLLDPLDKKLMSLILAAEAILGIDKYCFNYLKDYRRQVTNEKI